MSNETIDNLFAGDTYDTADGVKQAFGDKLFLKSRWYFYLKNFGTFIRTGLCAKKGGLTAARQVAFSNENIKLIERCGGRIHLRGLNHLRDAAASGETFVLMGNHMSLLETAVLHAIVRPHLDFTFVIKESLLKVPFFKEIMLALKAIPVTRANPREDFKTVLKEGTNTLNAVL